MSKALLVFFTFLLPTLLSTNVYSQSFESLSFIDHFNLRKMYDYDEPALRNHVAEIKANIDKAEEYDIDTYVLFSRSFEFLINYDFSLPEFGDLSGKVWEYDSDRRKAQKLYAEFFNEVLDYAEEKNIIVVFHTNQFDFPSKLYEIAGDKLRTGDNVCPGKPAAFDLLEAKIYEFFDKYPKCSGLQFTLTETQANMLRCNCEHCKHLNEGDRFLKVADTLSKATESLDKTLVIRTWGKFEDPELVKKLPKSIITSTKITLPDFHLTNYPNPAMGQNSPQEVEFDAWGEYSGFNMFPCYYGDIFAGRIKECADMGVERLGVRLNWEPGVRWIFGNDWGNECNVYLFSKLAKNPNANPDDILKEWISKTYPESSHKSAFNLYKRSTHIMTTFLIWNGMNANDHSRVYNWGGLERVKRQIEPAIPIEHNEAKKLLDEWRDECDKAYNEAISLVDALSDDVDQNWKKEMKRYARVHWFVSRGIADCIELYSADIHIQNGNKPVDISFIEDGIKYRARLWERTDAETYKLMYGNGALITLDQYKEKNL